MCFKNLLSFQRDFRFPRQLCVVLSCQETDTICMCIFDCTCFLHFAALKAIFSGMQEYQYCEYICISFRFSFLLFLNIYFVVCQVFIAERTFLQLRQGETALQLRCSGFSLRWLLSLLNTGSRPHGLLELRHVGSGTVAPGSRAQAQWLGPKGLVAPRCVGSSQRRKQTSVSCLAW